jgi:hypothetical protein
MAAQVATKKVIGLLDDDPHSLAETLEQMREEAAETEGRCTAVAGSFDGKKTAILDQARETKSEAAKMMDVYLGEDSDALDGFEFLTMAEAGEVGHWSIVAKFTERAENPEVKRLASWALPIQQRNYENTLEGSLQLAADENPDDPA